MKNSVQIAGTLRLHKHCSVIISRSHSILFHVASSYHTGEFTVETKNAGIGTILIRVHGIRDAFKIEAAPKSESDQRTLLAQYHPRIPGEYVIFVRWSGVHVPGSPFTVKIKRKPGEELLIGEKIHTHKLNLIAL